MNTYDFDKTIYKNDSSTDFLIYCLFRHPKAFCRIPTIIAGSVKYFVLKKGRKEDFKEKAFSIVKYCDINKDVADFWRKNTKKIKSFYIKQQKENDHIDMPCGHADFIDSGSGNRVGGVVFRLLG